MHDEEQNLLHHQKRILFTKEEESSPAAPAAAISHQQQQAVQTAESMLFFFVLRKQKRRIQQDHTSHHRQPMILINVRTKSTHIQYFCIPSARKNAQANKPALSNIVYAATVNTSSQKKSTPTSCTPPLSLSSIITYFSLDS